MKKALKFVICFAAGGAAGLLIVAIFAVLFTDTTFIGFFSKFKDIDIGALYASVVSLLALIVSVPLLSAIHEAGHLVAGCLTGYGFVSFRVFSLTLIKDGGHFRLKRFAIAGTGGQCLLSPPDVKAENMPHAWYNMGGVIATTIAVVAAVALIFVTDSLYLKIALTVFVIIAAIMTLMNGIPMKLGGISNDAYNMLQMRRDVGCRRAVAAMLRANALLQQGTRIKDMPGELFEQSEITDYSNPLQLSPVLLEASRRLDAGDTDGAFELYDSLYQHHDSLLRLYRLEVKCELLYICLISNRREYADRLLDTELLKYIETYAGISSSKQRMLAAIELFVNNNRTKAEQIYHTIITRRDTYLHKGEVDGDISLLSQMFCGDNKVS